MYRNRFFIQLSGHSGEMALRSGEKARSSSCPAADNIATLVIEKYRQFIGNSEGNSPQIVLAGIVAVYQDQAHVISLATGNKFQANGDKQEGSLRDCHAEILSRRGFKYWLLGQYAMLKAGKESEFFNPHITEDGRLRLQLKSGVEWILYISSCPCGNACIRRWGDSPKEIYNDSLGPFGLVNDQPHPTFLPHSYKEGQTAVTFKGQSTIHSCSDKILRWNILGLQGLSLSGLCSGRILLDGIVVGRKFVRKHAERAFCCRLTSKLIPLELRTAVHHPRLMCTAIKLDEAPLQVEVGAVFTEDTLWWVMGMNSPEWVDGNTGRTVAGRASRLLMDRESITKHDPDESLIKLADLLQAQFLLM
jgi:hypothetical protein